MNIFLKKSDINNKMLIKIIDFENNEYLFYAISTTTGGSSGRRILQGYFVSEMLGVGAKKEFFCSESKEIPFESEKIKGYIKTNEDVVSQFNAYLKKDSKENKGL